MKKDTILHNLKTETVFIFLSQRPVLVHSIMTGTERKNFGFIHNTDVSIHLVSSKNKIDYMSKYLN